LLRISIWLSQLLFEVIISIITYLIHNNIYYKYRNCLNSHIGKKEDYCVLKAIEIIDLPAPIIYFEMNFIPVIPAGNDDANNQIKENN